MELYLLKIGSMNLQVVMVSGAVGVLAKEEGEKGERRLTARRK